MKYEFRSIKTNSMKRYLIISLIALFAFGCTKTQKKGTQDELATPLEQHYFNKLTSYAELVGYLEKITEKSDQIALDYVGKSVEGKRLPLLKVARSGNWDNDRLTVFFFAQQHGDEPSGKEGMLLLLRDLARGIHNDWLDHANILIMPQVNPDGAELNKRHNAKGTDLNRDHLIMSSPEVQAVHWVFEEYKPEMTVDVHEYDPYSTSWRSFGYLKNFDIQLGGLTNKNVDPRLKKLFKNAALPFVGEYVKEKGYSFFEYTLGDFPSGGRLRHSTVDINDGRQSLGILNTLSFIVEGKYGKDSVDQLERRAKSQLRTAKGLILFAVNNETKIQKTVHKAREELKEVEKGDKVAIRMHHTKGENALKYPLRSMKSGNDTVFHVKKFHSDIVSVLDVKRPSGYLVPVSDKKLVEWMNRNYITYHDFNPDHTYKIRQYNIQKINRQVDEGLENYYPKVEQVVYPKQIHSGDYFFVPISQLRSNKIVTALEPQSMIGLVNYPSFEYLLLNNENYPVLRLIAS